MYIELIFAFIIGLIIGYFMFYDNITLFHGPNSKDIKDKIYYNKEKDICYKLVPKVHICPIKYSMT